MNGISLCHTERRRTVDPIEHVYVCHPYSHGGRADVQQIARNRAAVADIAASLIRDGKLPIAPQLYFDQFMSEANEREAALSLCLAILTRCDVVEVWSLDITDGMTAEIRAANAAGIPVRWVAIEEAEKGMVVP